MSFLSSERRSLGYRAPGSTLREPTWRLSGGTCPALSSTLGGGPTKAGVRGRPSETNIVCLPPCLASTSPVPRTSRGPGMPWPDSSDRSSCPHQHRPCAPPSCPGLHFAIAIDDAAERGNHWDFVGGELSVRQVGRGQGHRPSRPDEPRGHMSRGNREGAGRPTHSIP
jgi:hypothetical protein